LESDGVSPKVAEGEEKQEQKDELRFRVMSLGSATLETRARGKTSLAGGKSAPSLADAMRQAR